MVWKLHPQLSNLMKKAAILIAMLSATVVHGANFPQDFQAALRLYEAGKITEARVAFLKLRDLKLTPQATDQSLLYAAYCDGRLKAHDEAYALASAIQDKYLGMLCQMNLMTMESKFADIIAISKSEDFEKWPDALIHDAFVCRGNAFARTRNIAEAERDFSAALTQTQSEYMQALVHLRLGNLFADSGKDERRALDAFAEVFKLKAVPTLLCRAGFVRANLFAAQGKRDQAVAEFDRVKDITKQPHWSIVQMGCAGVYEKLGEPDKAIACYKAVVASAHPPSDLLAKAKTKLNEEKR